MRIEINKKDEELIHLAHKLIKKRQSKFCGVACVLKTKNKKIYTGVNIESLNSGPCSMCAEYPAIGQMYKEGEKDIDTIVAVTVDGKIIPPCGRCREIMRQFGNPYVILQKDGKPFKIKLSELIPFWEGKE